MTDINVKEMTDALEAKDGCALQLALQGMRYPEQEAAFDKLSAEAQSRPDNHLSFVKRSIDVILPGGKPSGDKISILDIKNGESLIFEVFKEPNSNGVQGICKFPSDKR